MDKCIYGINMTGLGDCFRWSLGEGRRVKNDSWVLVWLIRVQVMPFTKIENTEGNNWFENKHDESESEDIHLAIACS